MTGTTPTPPAKQPPNLDLYSVVAQRRTGNDGMVWQAPILSLTAQAFLLTIALAADSEPAARYISAGLALVAAVASIQLMAKHRTFERWDSEWLKRYEEAHFDDGKTSGGHLVYGKVHARNDQTLLKDLLGYDSFLPRKWPRRIREALWWITTKCSSYSVWMFVLAFFAVGAAAVLAITMFSPALLTGVPTPDCS